MKSNDFNEYAVTHEGMYEHYVTENTIAVIDFKMTSIYTADSPFVAQNNAYRELRNVFPKGKQLYVQGINIKLIKDA